MKTCGGSITRPKMAYNGYHRRLGKMPSRSSYVLVAEFDPLSASCLCAQPELASVVPERSENDLWNQCHCAFTYLETWAAATA